MKTHKPLVGEAEMESENFVAVFQYTGVETMAKRYGGELGVEVLPRWESHNK